MPTTSKFKIFFSLFLVITTLLLLRPTQISAYPGPSGTCDKDESTPLPDCDEIIKSKAADWVQAVYGTEDMNLQSYVNEVITNVIFSLGSLIISPDQIPPSPDALKDFLENIRDKLATVETRQEFIASLPVTPIDAIFRYPPASGVDYVKSLAQNFSIIPEAQAQGFGYTQFESFHELWSWSRNIAYSFFFIVFIAAGFAIMFRVKLSPQSVASIQSLLPRAIVILILITFSYAIVGFMVDLMYVSAYLLSSVLAPHTLLGATGNFIAWLANRIPLIGSFIPSGWGTTAVREAFHLPFAWITVIPMIIVLVASFVAAAGVSFIFLLPATLLSAPFNGGASLIIGAIPSALVGFLAVLIMLILMIINYFKIFLMLIKAYIGVFVSLVTGPLQIIFGIFPGSKSIGSWFNSLIANLAVFPTIFIMFMLLEVIGLDILNKADATWIPPLLGVNTNAFIGNPILQWLVGIPASIFVKSLLIVGLYLLIPKAADIVKSALERKPFQFDTALGEAWKDTRSFGTPAAVGLGTAAYTAASSTSATGSRWRDFGQNLLAQGGQYWQGIRKKTGFGP